MTSQTNEKNTSRKENQHHSVGQLAPLSKLDFDFEIKEKGRIYNLESIINND